MTIDFLKAAGFILDITVDMTKLDEGVKSEYLKRKKSEQDYIDKHLEVTGLKYDSITNITYVVAELDEDIIDKYKAFSNKRIKQLVDEISKVCGEMQCDDCPYYSQDLCLLRHSNSFPNMWTYISD